MKRTLLFLGLVLGSLLVLFVIFHNGPEFVDEWGHGEQILKLAHGDFSRAPSMTTLCGYHAVSALLVKITGAQSLVALRFFSLLGGFAAVLFFYQIVTLLWPQERFWRTVQFAYFPLLFPYFFLVYTDLLCLAFVLLAVLFALRERVVASAMAVAVAVLTRQPAIFWAAIIWLWFLAPSAQTNFGWKSIYPALKRTWPFLILIACFALFVAWNHGVALGAQSVQKVTLNLTNVWFFLFTVCLLFAPDCLSGVYVVWQHCRHEKRLMLAALLILLTSWVLFGLTYELSNIFNKINLDYLLHNMVLYEVATQPWARLMALAVIPFGLAGWLYTPLSQERFRWLLPLGLASVVVLPYVEPRYYIVPLSLFLAFRRPSSRVVEAGLTVFYVAFSLWINAAAFGMRFFP